MPELGPRDHEDASQRAEFQLFLRQRGIRSNNVLRALETVPRTMFVPDEMAPHAYADRALPIACGQTISQPFLVAYMTEQLELNDTHKVLEVGTGTGYQTAVLARIGRRIYTIDRYRTLVSAAEARLQSLRITNVTAMPGDGAQGWPAQAPFDRIMVTAAADQIPKPLIDQLAEGGIMIIPVGTGDQRLMKVVKGEDGKLTEKSLMAVRFVPLVAGRAASL
ncbi:protein-L-isoaspartate O-methyltransferase [Terrihabitans soli]|uniref:Protein-L-isoaspartate O-methyltransferase n=1 Tax=Terrihabitans soli TaxID=708113 RepID=A0A6S6QHP9_9HYPH|nr:protein-L-isoaspartate(D-aspartate) O-methyltransferase [Terrihabitans soli]BCJ90713.1 protein-L-isoaspartate O-methyltransferase [Terrihabitans soli]